MPAFKFRIVTFTLVTYEEIRMVDVPLDDYYAETLAKAKAALQVASFTLVQLSELDPVVIGMRGRGETRLIISPRKGSAKIIQLEPDYPDESA